MAIIMLINNETVRDGLQYLNDVVGVFEDGYQFSGTELEKFNFLTVGGTKQEVASRLRQLTPVMEKCYLWESDNKYHWTDGDEETILDEIEAYQIEGDIKWFKAENDFKFPVNFGELTAEEKQLLATVNINHPSVDSFIRKLIKDITVLSGNNVEIKELKNTSP